MVVATYNVASVRARLPLLLDWIAVNEPDVLCLQETKVEDDKFPRDEFEELGYCIALNGQKSWNGVATLSRSPILNVQKGFGDPLMPEDARLLQCEIDGITILNTYVPNGTAVGTDKFDYKLRWLDRMLQYLCERHDPGQPFIWLGDINIARRSEDVYNPKRFFGKVGHHPEEISRLDRILDWGLTDLYRLFHQGPGHYTYWDFVILTSVEKNFGWRIDCAYGTQPILEKCIRAWIDREARTVPKPSDHTLMCVELDW